MRTAGEIRIVLEKMGEIVTEDEVVQLVKEIVSGFSIAPCSICCRVSLSDTRVTAFV